MVGGLPFIIPSATRGISALGLPSRGGAACPQGALRALRSTRSTCIPPCLSSCGGIVSDRWKMKRFVLLVFLAFLLTGCAQKEEKQEIKLTAFTVATATNKPEFSDVPERYRPFYYGMPDIKDFEKAKADLPFDSITLERTGCLGRCPVYKVTFFRSGTARLEANGFMPLEGNFEGRVSIYTFARLCFAIEKLGFASFKTNYPAQWTDGPTCIVTVFTKTGSKSVSDDSGIVPIELWTIQNVLDHVREEVEWKPLKGPN
jgi:hypothetical protein